MILIIFGIVVVGIFIWALLTGRINKVLNGLGDTARENIVKLALWAAGILLVLFIILLGLGALFSFGKDPFLVLNWILGAIGL